jgi:hypothetical protein
MRTTYREGGGFEEAAASSCEWQGAAQAHAEAFAGVEPAKTTYFVSGFIPDGVLVEVELDAVVTEPPR